MLVQLRNGTKKVTINNYRSIFYGVFLCYFLFYCFLAVDNFFFTVQELRFVRALLNSIKRVAGHLLLFNIRLH